MDNTLKVWFDREGDFLEVCFSDTAGYMIETENDALMQRVDENGHVTGFSILGVSKLKKDQLLNVSLPMTVAVNQ